MVYLYCFVGFIIYYATVSFVIYENKKTKYELSLLIEKNSNIRSRAMTSKKIKSTEKEHIDALIWPAIIIKYFLNAKKKK
jgi:hypothetical protein